MTYDKMSKNIVIEFTTGISAIGMSEEDIDKLKKDADKLLIGICGSLYVEAKHGMLLAVTRPDSIIVFRPANLDTALAILGISNHKLNGTSWEYIFAQDYSVRMYRKDIQVYETLKFQL